MKKWLILAVICLLLAITSLVFVVVTANRGDLGGILMFLFSALIFALVSTFFLDKAEKIYYSKEEEEL